MMHAPFAMRLVIRVIGPRLSVRHDLTALRNGTHPKLTMTKPWTLTTKCKDSESVRGHHHVRGVGGSSMPCSSLGFQLSG